MPDSDATQVGEALLGILQTLGALLFSIVYILESFVKALLPRSFKRHSVQGQIILITGGGNGLGRLVAQRLAKLGAKIVTWDVNAAGNEETKQLIVKEGGECHCYEVDLCNRQAIYAAAEKVKKDVGKVDILVNNAGIVTGKSFQDSPDDLIQKTFDVNIISHFWTTKAFLPDMIKDGKGQIVTVASLAGHVGVNKLADYCASKFAAVGFDESLRLEMMVEGYKGLSTTVICPYYINTGMFQGVKSKVLPILDQEYVADEITDGILMKSAQVILPKYATLIVALKTCFPYKGFFLISKYMGGNSSMDSFVGRHKQEEPLLSV